MSQINLAAVMEGIAQACLDAEVIDRAYGWPNPVLTPPALAVSYPETVALDATFEGGASRCNVPVWVVFGNVEQKQARDVCSAFLLGISHAINGPHAWCQSAYAGTVNISSTPNVDDGTMILTARFDVDVLT